MERRIDDGAGAVAAAQVGAGATTATASGVAVKRTNGLVIASLIPGITWISSVGSLFAVILGHVALNLIDNSRGPQSGRPLAVARLVLGNLAFGPRSPLPRHTGGTRVLVLIERVDALRGTPLEST